MLLWRQFRESIRGVGGSGGGGGGDNESHCKHRRRLRIGTANETERIIWSDDGTRARGASDDVREKRVWRGGSGRIFVRSNTLPSSPVPVTARFYDVKPLCGYAHDVHPGKVNHPFLPKRTRIIWRNVSDAISRTLKSYAYKYNRVYTLRSYEVIAYYSKWFRPAISNGRIRANFQNNVLRLGPSVWFCKF